MTVDSKPAGLSNVGELIFWYVVKRLEEGPTRNSLITEARSLRSKSGECACSDDEMIRAVDYGISMNAKILEARALDADDGGPVKQDCSCDASDKVASAQFNTMEYLMFTYCCRKMRQFDNMYRGMIATINYNNGLEHPLPPNRLATVIEAAGRTELAREGEDGRRRADEIRRNMKPDGRVMTAISKSHGSLEHRIRKLELWVEGFTAAGPLSKEAAD